MLRLANVAPARRLFCSDINSYHERGIDYSFGITIANCRFYPNGYYIVSQVLKGYIDKEKACYL